MSKKKLVIAFVFMVLCATVTWASETTESEIYYISVPIVKALQHREGYVIYYKKKSSGIGKVYLPKKWFTVHERKATFGVLDVYLNPYLTVFYRNGEFDHVRISLSSKLSSPVWGGLYIDNNAQEKFDIDTLDIQF